MGPHGLPFRGLSLSNEVSGVLGRVFALEHTALSL